MRYKLKWYKGLNHIELESCMKYTEYNQVIQVFKTMLISIVEYRCVECYNNMPNHVDCCFLWMLKHAQFSEPDNKKPHILHPPSKSHFSKKPNFLYCWCLINSCIYVEGIIDEIHIHVLQLLPALLTDW